MPPGISAPPLVGDAEITINGRIYQLSALPLEVRDLIYFYQKWEAQLAEERIAYMKTDAAMRSVSVELSSRLKDLDQKDPSFSRPEGS